MALLVLNAAAVPRTPRLRGGLRFQAWSPASKPLARTPYYVLTGGLAIIFLFPIIWSAIASVSRRHRRAQIYGYGLGNYVTTAQLHRRSARCAQQRILV